MVVDHGQHDVRELRAQAGDGAGHERREGGRHAAEPQSPLLPAEDVEEVALGGVEAGDDGPGVLGQDVAGGSRCTGRAPRSTRPAPTWRSSAATCWLTADWLTPSAAAAPENDPAASTAARACRRGPAAISLTYQTIAISLSTDETSGRP